ncbi:MAG TPA: ATP-binding protein [Candidatus Baltobacteraceae bacterium]|nr:ATP-binding protein [Candidatus Baltobacteraceae bacterium]
MNQPLSDAESFDVVELRVPCKAEWVALARLSVAAVASRLNFSIDEIEDIKIAVAEACTNAIQHAKECAYIQVKCEAIPGGLRIGVRDYGRGTRPDAIRSRDLDEERVGGLGVFLIRSLMDDVHYDVHPDEGTNLVMVKKLLN